MPEKHHTIKPDEHSENFIRLSDYLSGFISGTIGKSDFVSTSLTEAVSQSMTHNGFFTEENILFALGSIAQMIEKKHIRNWIDHYRPAIEKEKKSKTVGVVMAGNIPLVGFHDFLCVLISGNKFYGKLSSDDKYLLPAIAEILCRIDERYIELIKFSDDRLQGFDAVIATGSNNTSRYFDYYFGKYPNIIRGHRNSVAVLSGDETDDQLKLLAEDIFRYFGLGCRNVSKIFITENYNLQRLISMMEPYSDVINNNKYKNNYDYYRTIFMMDNRTITDAGFFLMIEDSSLYSPVSAVNYEVYMNIDEVKSYLRENAAYIQCIVGNNSCISGCVNFGMTQHPELFDYADNLDTLEFLLNI